MKASTAKPKVALSKQLKESDITPIMKPAITKISEKVARQIEFLAQFEGRSRMPLTFQFPHWIKGSVHFADCDLQQIVPGGQALNIGHVRKIIQTHFDLLVKIEPADMVVILSSEGPLYSIKHELPSAKVQLLLIAPKTVALINVGPKAGLSPHLMNELSGLHSWQILGGPNANGTIPNGYKEVGLNADLTCVWVARANTACFIQVPQNAQECCFRYPPHWIIAAVVLGGKEAMYKASNLHTFATVLPIGQCLEIDLADLPKLCEFILFCYKLLPADAAVNFRGFKLQIAQFTWDGICAVPAALQEFIYDYTLSPNLAYSFGRNTEKPDHILVRVAIAANFDGDTPQGILIKHFGPIEGPSSCQ